MIKTKAISWASTLAGWCTRTRCSMSLSRVALRWGLIVLQSTRLSGAVKWASKQRSTPLKFRLSTCHRRKLTKTRWRSDGSWMRCVARLTWRKKKKQNWNYWPKWKRNFELLQLKKKWRVPLAAVKPNEADEAMKKMANLKDSLFEG